MTVAKGGDPFFPPDWLEQVKALLEPYKSDEPFEYSISIVRQKWYDDSENNRHRYWDATLRLGDIFLAGEEMHGFGGGGEERATVLYARKSEFSSPLHFWACAMLICTPMDDGDGPTTWSWLGLRAQSSRAVSASEFQSIIEGQWPREYKSGALMRMHLPLPSVFEEPVLRAWHNPENWNKQFTWAETSESFIMWRWQTYV